MSFPGVRGRARGLRAVFSGQGTSSAPRDLFTASSRLVRGNLFTEAQRETQPIAMTWRVIQNPDLRGWFFCLFRGCGCVLVEGEDLSLGQLDHRTRQYSQNRSSHGPYNRPAGRGDRSPPPGPRPQSPRTPRTTGRPPALSQAEEIGAAPAHLRRDRARAEPAESFGAGRASTCRAVRRWTARPVEVLAGLVPAADDPDQPRALVVDGAPVPCRDRKHEPGPRSGGHHRAGPPGRLHPGRKTRTGARPGPRDRPTTREPLN